MPQTPNRSNRPDCSQATSELQAETALDGASPTRERLLRAGLELARERGLRALTVRAVAGAADVNLGSFVYHFGTRQAFIAELISHWYAPLVQQLGTAVAGLSGQASMRDVILMIADWMMLERRFVGHLVMDAAAGEQAAEDFLRDNTRLPPALVEMAIGQAQAQGQIDPGVDPRHVMMAVLGVVGLPILLFAAFGGAKVLPREYAASFEHYSFDRAHIEQRLDWLFRGLAPR